PSIAVLAPDERLAYVTGYQENLIEAINLRTLRIARRFRVPERIWALAVSRDGTRLLVSTTPFPAGPPTNQCQGVLIPGADPSHLVIVNAFSGVIEHDVPLPAQALNLLPAANGASFAAVTHTGVVVIDPASGGVIESVVAPAADLTGEVAYADATW